MKPYLSSYNALIKKFIVILFLPMLEEGPPETPEKTPHPPEAAI
jgi:hypothetical protein